MNNILDRFKDIAKNEAITITKLEKNIGASKGVLSRAISNNSDIQAKWILQLVENYPQYSCEWILKGELPMIKSENKINRSNEPDENHFVNYKDLADSRKETIDCLKKEISHLEEKLSSDKRKAG